MMRRFFACLLAGVSLSAAPMPDVLTVDKVWSGHPVNFALLTAPPHQYVAYYDAGRQLTVAQRRLDQENWTCQKLPSALGWDSHNSVTMALDRTGRLHVSGNMHVVPLVYFRMTAPHDVASLAPAAMIGERELRVTYPVFFKDKSGRLVFRYRDGSSGNGDDLYNVYDEETGRWTRLMKTSFTAGGGRMNAYCTPPRLGPDGRFHLCWVWRDTPDCSTNHHLSYARSDDLVNWTDSYGRALALPITIATGEVVDPVPPQGGLLNTNRFLGFDNQGRVVLTYHKYDAAGDLQVYAARREARGWNIVQVSDWKGYRWEFSGGGTLVPEVALGPVQPVGEGKLALAYHYPRGAGTWVLDEATLKPLPGAKLPRRTDFVWPVEARKPADDFPGLRRRQAADLGQPGEDVAYRLEWETLDANRDRPRPPPLPGPSTLRLVRGVPATR